MAATAPLHISITVAVLALAVLVPLTAENNQAFETTWDLDFRPVCPSGSAQPRRITRIVGGRNADRDFPYQVGILIRSSSDYLKLDRPFCAGVLITERYVLSAAHCFEKRSASNLIVDVGDYDLSSRNDSQSTFCTVVEIVRYSNFTTETFNDDIALLQLNQSVPFTGTIRAACLPPNGSDVSVGIVLTVLGWGRTRYNKRTRPSILQEVSIPVINRTECQIPMPLNITDKMFCAGGTKGKDACLGDSGGPILMQTVNDYVLVGVVSFGKECALPGVAGVYTRLGRYVDWIYNQTIDSACKPCVLSPQNYPS